MTEECRTKINVFGTCWCSFFILWGIWNIATGGLIVELICIGIQIWFVRMFWNRSKETFYKFFAKVKKRVSNILSD